jgi:hypothetical protein
MGTDRLMKLLPALLKASGAAVEFEQVEATREAFIPLGEAASLPGAALLRIRGRLKDGSIFTGLLVANQMSDSRAELPEKST